MSGQISRAMSPEWSFKYGCKGTCFVCGNNGLSALNLVMTVLDGSVCVVVHVEVTAPGRCSTAVSKIPLKCLPL